MKDPRPGTHLDFTTKDDDTVNLDAYPGSPLEAHLGIYEGQTLAAATATLDRRQLATLRDALNEILEGPTP